MFPKVLRKGKILEKKDNIAEKEVQIVLGIKEDYKEVSHQKQVLIIEKKNNKF